MGISRTAKNRAPLCLLMAACLLGIAAAPSAHAALNVNLLISPTAMSLGNAVTADPPGIESIHFNPAGLARMTGNTKYDNFFGASLRTHESYHSAPDMD